MKSMIVVALALVAVAVAVPVDNTETKIVRNDFEQQPDGSYKSAFETDDGTKREEEGKLVEVLNEENKPVTVLVIRGSYTYINPDGVEETITYSANENGYQADGPSVPKAATA